MWFLAQITFTLFLLNFLTSCCSSENKIKSTPPQFEEKLRNQTVRRGEPTVLQCEVKGEKPIEIVWTIDSKKVDLEANKRYKIREEILQNGVLSDFSIKRAERSDSVLFTCEASNFFGDDNTSINLIVQEVPEIPFGLKVLDKFDNSIHISWIAPYNGNSPINKYIIEYNPCKSSSNQEWRQLIVKGQETNALIVNLEPATTYHIRMAAENEIGASNLSDIITIQTAKAILQHN